MAEDQEPEVVQGETVALAERPVLFPAGPPPTLKEVYWMAQALSSGQGAVTLPENIRRSAPDILAVMLAGRELGIGPMAATRMVHVINGQTALATELKLALAKQAGHDIAPIAEGPGWCLVGCKRHPDADGYGWAIAATADLDAAPRCESWTFADEIVQETRSGPKRLIDKDNWRMYQRNMLWNRASADFMRRHCPGVGGGFYTIEELGGDAE
jgi:hypothetical protein